MDIGEAIKIAVGHDPDHSDDCPFCPQDPPKKFKTYKGKDNNGSTLGEIMQNPSTLTAKQAGARPKTGAEGEQEPPDPKPKPSLIHEEYGAYTFEAHHITSGNQILKGHIVERWIAADAPGSYINNDTGYAINNSENGVWLPSIPEKHTPKIAGNHKYEERIVNGKKKDVRVWENPELWGSKEESYQQAASEFAMKELKSQFHKGGHDITDENDPEGEYHSSYVKYLTNGLKEIHDRIIGWSFACPLHPNKKEGDNKKFDPNFRVNQALDRYSAFIEGKIADAPVCSWEIFISKLALQYHYRLCHMGAPGPGEGTKRKRASGRKPKKSTKKVKTG